MDWVTTTADPNETLDGLIQNIRVLRDAPGKLTERTNKLAQPDDQSQELDVAAFKASDKEPAQHAKARLAAYQAGWSRIQEAMRVQQQEAMVPLHKALHSYVISQHAAAVQRSCNDADALVLGAQRLPTAIVAAAGLNAADYITTFTELKQHLQERQVHAALLTSSDINQGIAAVLAEAFRQLSGLDSGAEDMAGLAAWYASTYRPAAPAAPAAGTAAAQQPADSAAAGPQQQAGGADVKRQLRARAAPPPAGQQQPAAAAAAAVLPLTPSPVVIMVQGAEQCEVGVLRSLAAALSQAHSSVPACLLLGISTSANLFKQCLPLDLLAALDLSELRMPPASSRLQELFRHVLLGAGPGLPPLVLGPAAASHLLQHFQQLDGSISMLRDALQLAALLHYQQQPLSSLCPALASADSTDVARAVAELPAALAQQAAAGLPLPPAPGARAPRSAGSSAEADTRRAVERQLWQAAEAFVEWRMGVLLLHGIATATGALRGERCVYQLSQLYCLAAHPHFWAPGGGEPLPNTAQALVSELVTSVSERSLLLLGDVECSAVLRQLLPLVSQAAATSARAKHVAQQLQQLLQAADGSAAAAALQQREQQQEQQQEQAEREEAEDVAAATPLTKLNAKLQQQKACQQGQPGAGLTPLGKGLASMGLASAAGKRKSPRAATEAAGQAAEATEEAGTSPAAAAGAADAAASLLSPVRQGLQGLGLAAPSKAQGQALGVAAPKVGRVMTATARKQMILEAAAQAQRAVKNRQQQGGAGTASAAAAAAGRGGGGSSSRDLAKSASKVLADCLLDCFAQQPFSMPGASVVCFDGAEQLASLLSPPAPARLHAALAQPHNYLLSLGSKPVPAWADACIAYHSLQQTADLLPVTDWFAEFCAVYGMVDQQQQAGKRGRGRAGRSKQEIAAQQQAAHEGRARTKGRGRRSKAAREAEEAAAAAAAAAAEAAAAAAERDQGPAVALELNQENLQLLAARFSQAAAELQLLGAWRSTKRRKQAIVQRAFFPAVAV